MLWFSHFSGAPVTGRHRSSPFTAHRTAPGCEATGSDLVAVLAAVTQRADACGRGQGRGVEGATEHGGKHLRSKRGNQRGRVVDNKEVAVYVLVAQS